MKRILVTLALTSMFVGLGLAACTSPGPYSGKSGGRDLTGGSVSTQPDTGADVYEAGGPDVKDSGSGQDVFDATGN